jgi:hypothetical protein
MPTIEHHGAQIHLEEHGQGFPILTFAPAGLRSVINVWSQPSAPIKPVADFTGFRVIVMDQRNAGGQSNAPITARDNWDNYTADHLAVLDHLRIDKCHLYGQCIGGSFIINMLKHHPERVQPGFVYCADRDFVKTIKAPCLILAGNDEAHPWPISEELSKLIPGCEFVREWKTEPALTPARARVTEFFREHTPAH